MKGLDGLDEGNQISGDLTDKDLQERYRQFEKHRGYVYRSVEVKSICKTCGAIPCICDKGSLKPSGLRK